MAKEGFHHLMIESLEPHPENPRKTFPEDGLRELADSIAEHDLIEPLLVAPAREHPHEERYRIVCGERRWRAAQMAGRGTLPCIVREMDRRQQLEAMLVENLQRVDVDAVEEARAFGLLLHEGYTQEQLADKIGKSQPYIANRLRLCKLPADVQESISREIIPPSVGLALVKAAPWPEVCRAALEAVVEEDATAKEAPLVVDQVMRARGRPLTPGAGYRTGIKYLTVVLDPAIFDDHPDRVMLRPWQGRDPEPYLMDVDAWSKEQQKALDDNARRTLQQLQALPDAPPEAARAAEKAEKNPTPGKADKALQKALPKLSDLDYRKYEELDGATFDTAVCDGCEYRKYALDYAGRPKPICIAPAEFRKKTVAVTRERNKRLKEELETEFGRIKAAAADLVPGLATLDRPLLVYLATLLLQHVAPNYGANGKARMQPLAYARALWGDDFPNLVSTSERKITQLLCEQPAESLAQAILEWPAIAKGANKSRIAGVLYGDITPRGSWEPNVDEIAPADGGGVEGGCPVCGTALVDGGQCPQCDRICVDCLERMRFHDGEVCPQKCGICGCTDYAGCDGGCEWVAPGLCSSCTEDGHTDNADEWRAEVSAALWNEAVEVPSDVLHAWTLVELAWAHEWTRSMDEWDGDGDMPEPPEHLRPYVFDDGEEESVDESPVSVGADQEREATAG